MDDELNKHLMRIFVNGVDISDYQSVLKAIQDSYLAVLGKTLEEVENIDTLTDTEREFLSTASMATTAIISMISKRSLVEEFVVAVKQEAEMTASPVGSDEEIRRTFENYMDERIDHYINQNKDMLDWVNYNIMNAFMLGMRFAEKPNIRMGEVNPVWDAALQAEADELVKQIEQEMHDSVDRYLADSTGPIL